MLLPRPLAIVQVLHLRPLLEGVTPRGEYYHFLSNLPGQQLGHNPGVLLEMSRLGLLLRVSCRVILSVVRMRESW